MRGPRLKQLAECAQLAQVNTQLDAGAGALLALGRGQGFVWLGQGRNDTFHDLADRTQQCHQLLAFGHPFSRDLAVREAVGGFVGMHQCSVLQQAFQQGEFVGAFGDTLGKGHRVWPRGGWQRTAMAQCHGAQAGQQFDAGA